jgi:hypothetical protein
MDGAPRVPAHTSTLPSDFQFVPSLDRHPYDRRTLLGRRITALASTFRQRLGDDITGDPVLGAAVECAARLVAYNEMLSAKALRVSTVDQRGLRPSDSQPVCPSERAGTQAKHTAVTTALGW